MSNRIPRPFSRRPCIGGCGRFVLKSLGAECRKCRKARLHKGARLLRNLRREDARKRRKAAEQRLKKLADKPMAGA